METYNGGIRHGPLRRSANAIVQALLVGIVPSISVCQKKSIDAPLFQELSELNPVSKVTFCRRPILWVLS